MEELLFFSRQYLRESILFFVSVVLSLDQNNLLIWTHTLERLSNGEMAPGCNYTHLCTINR